MATRSILLRASMAAMLSLPAPLALAQNDGGSALVAPREGNTYDFRAYQPTEAAPSAETDAQVNDDVKALLKQSDEIDRQTEQELVNPGK